MAKIKKPSLDVTKAIAEIKAITAAFEGILPAKLKPIKKLVAGKVYELYALSRLLSELQMRGWAPRFLGATIDLKASPGGIDPTSPHFELAPTPGAPPEYKVFTDIEVMTLGSNHTPVTDFSGYHEIDLVVVPVGTSGRPLPDQLALGVECKATANFEKGFVREVLGRRRELSFFHQPLPCALDPSKSIRANPPSEYWLVYIDKAGDNYVQSPDVFAVELKHWQP